MPAVAFGYGTDVNAVWSGPFLRRLFHDLDSDRDGCLTKLETSIALHRLNVYVPPSRISTFFTQAANLTESQRSVITFRQFQAFVLAAKDANWQPPTQPKPVHATALPQQRAPLVLDDVGAAAFDVEQALPEVIAARVFERMDETARSSIDAETVRQIARELLQEQLKMQQTITPGDTTGLVGMEAELTMEPTPVQMNAVEMEVHAADLVKEFLVEHMRQFKPALVSLPCPSMPKESPPEVPEIAPSMDQVVDTRVATMEQATDTNDLVEAPPPALPSEVVAVEVQEKHVVRNVADLPGKTLLGKLLHCDAIGECNVRGQMQPPTSLASTLRQMRAARLRRTVRPPPSPRSPRRHHANDPPPPAPPLSPVSEFPPHTWQLPSRQHILPAPPQAFLGQVLPAALADRPNSTPLDQQDPAVAHPSATKIYSWDAPAMQLGVAPRPTSVSSVNSRSVDSSVAIESQNDGEDLLSEGEVLHVPDDVSDGEVDGGPAHSTFYHLHNAHWPSSTRRAVVSAPPSNSSSVEDGQLHTLFMPASSIDDNASSTGSIESGEYVHRGRDTARTSGAIDFD
ncbi:hypothetical protein H310_09287 [Aphanomyces invadans]|uniref:EF-hand domain-containing protein n=1 Tax=Aphanomyces invadans TaxID=157072 RepID=A0A024TXC5_9STRA|nr:hypothetical protein H310_09287 [Aphanomyces invadans]ETV97982.1 hypothetical protein H310_09287 [Aphanomyces invadans]|eukprot:XP_008873543.1 hypothetical protein H310_09287 [Aphanomyces invadans]